MCMCACVCVSTLNSTGSKALQDDALRYAEAAKAFAKNWTSLALSMGL